MKKISLNIMALSLLVLASCSNQKGQEKAASETTLDSTQIRYAQLPPVTPLSKERLQTINQWKEFSELDQLMQRFQQQNEGDLSYYVEEFIRLNKKLATDSLVPVKFKQSSINSRVLVLNTFALQLNNRLNENASLDSIEISRKRVMDAYNGLRKEVASHSTSKLYEEFLKQQGKTSK